MLLYNFSITIFIWPFSFEIFFSCNAFKYLLVVLFVLLILIAIFLYLFYKNILNYYLNNIVCLLISGVLYTVLADLLLCKILVNEMILSVNEKIAHVIKSKLFWKFFDDILLVFGYDYLIVIVSDEWLVLMIMYNVFA